LTDVRAVALHLTGVAALLALAGSSETASATRLAACGPPRARTVARSAAFRIFLDRREIYGCRPGSRKLFHLVGSEWEPAVSSSGGGGIRIIALAGRYVAWTDETYDDTSNFTELRVADLRSRRFLLHHEVGVGKSDYEYVYVLDLCSNGNAAWIESSGENAQSPAVWRLTGHRLQLLDASSAIARHSLGVHRHRLTWSNHGNTLSAPLDCPLPTPAIRAPHLTVDQVLRD